MNDDYTDQYLTTKVKKDKFSKPNNDKQATLKQKHTHPEDLQETREDNCSNIVLLQQVRHVLVEFSLDGLNGQNIIRPLPTHLQKHNDCKRRNNKHIHSELFNFFCVSRIGNWRVDECEDRQTGGKQRSHFRKINNYGKFVIFGKQRHLVASINKL